MDELILTRDLTAQGFSTDEIKRLVRRGDLVHIRRGAYERHRDRSDTDDPYDLRAPHRRLIAATEAQLHPRAVLSHGSAATMWGLPLFRGMLGAVHVTRVRRGGGVRRSFVFVHGSPLSEDDRAAVDGLAVTSLARTAVDLARTLPYDQAVAVADAACAAGADPARVVDALDQARRWYGAPQGRRVFAFADARSESVGESFSRLRLREAGLPAPELQLEVFDEMGRLLGRSDFAWPEHRTLGEFDGRVKYGRLRRPGETVEEAVHREKLRENAFRDHGWQVVRWIWDDLARPQIISERVRRAFARAGVRPNGN